MRSKINHRALRILYEIVVLAAAVCLLWNGLFLLGCSLMPERTTFGAVWSSYLQEERESVDVLFLGSSRAYCNVIPARIFRNTGVTSYVMAGPSQTTSMSYYYLRECLKTQKPKCVFMECSGAFYGLYEEHSKANVCYMPGGINRILAARQCEDGILDLAFYPLQEFHFRIYAEDRDLPPEEDGVMLCGYTPLSEAAEQTERTVRKHGVKGGDERYAHNLSYLKKIAELCRDEGVICIFYYAPAMGTYEESSMERLMADLSQTPCAAVENWGNLIEEIGIDSALDWFDSIHFNQSGATKFSDYLSAYIKDLGIPETQGANADLWAKRYAYLYG